MIGTMLTFSAYGQSKLPPCQGSETTKWSNCFGTYYIVKGSMYVGEWRDGNYNGLGTYTAPDGSKYVGDWKDDKRHGLGINTYSDGRPSLEGIWADGKFVRAEKLNLPNQQTDLALNEERRRVEVAQNTQSNLPPCPASNEVRKHMCFGTYTFSGGNKYLGEWKDGNMHGQGIYNHASGVKYVGEFQDNAFNGKGTYTYANGSVEEGIWVNNKFVRAEKINLPNQKTDLALNEERRRLEADRQALISNLESPRNSWRPVGLS